APFAGGRSACLGALPARGGQPGAPRRCRCRDGIRASPYPRSGPSRSQGAPCRPRKPASGRGFGCPGCPEGVRRRKRVLSLEGAARLSFHGPVTLPLLFRLCWRPSGEAKTWRPPKSVGVAGGRAGPSRPRYRSSSGSCPGGGRAGRPAPSSTGAAGGPPPSPAGAAGQNKQHSITKNTAKLDRETEELHHDRVPLEVGKVIQQGRQNKGLTQKDLATKINEKPQVIADYESGKAIPNNQVLGKIERAIGLKLRGRDIGRPLEKAPKGK
uniref:Endothelial differentiation related factor 1 n=1 Tax=Pseudonaja textilis TaxID=8673 RepID=A0A670YHF1_PSETE